MSVIGLVTSFARFVRRSLSTGAPLGGRTRLLKGSAALIFLLTVGGVLGSYTPALKVGYDIWRERGVKEAYTFFKDRLGEDEEDSATQFGYAWMAYRNQQFEEAAELSLKMLEETESPEEEAQAAYLLGNIHADTGRYELARHYLSQALSYFRGKEMGQDVHQTLLALVYVNIWSGDLDLARQLLDEAEFFLGAAREQGSFYLARAELSFWEENPAAALHYSRIALEGAGEYVEQKIAALSFQALNLMVLGQFAEAETPLVEARLLAVERGDVRAYHYSLIPEIVQARCTSIESRSLEAQVQKWSIKNKDLALLKYLEFARLRSCGSEWGGFGTPQPPSNPDDPPPAEEG